MAVHPFGGLFSGRSVLITGHTGFKGSWLSLWLRHLGARVVGYALAPPTNPSLFDALALSEDLAHVIADVRELRDLRRVMTEHQPEVVFHLAAQPLVRESYATPIETLQTNVMGTANVLEAVRATPSVRAVVVVTSDKCYENREWEYAYRENDPMGGHDLYSASKGCAELVAASFRCSFFPLSRFSEHRCAIATARAGNVIGGGDWAADRIVPDIFRALRDGVPVPMRNPGSVRPWQHVLEPLSGYLWLAARLLQDGPRFASAWNFGPLAALNMPVSGLVAEVLHAWGEGSSTDLSRGQVQAPHEAKVLRLDCTKATSELGWAPLYSFSETVQATTRWYRRFLSADVARGMRAFTLEQISDYEKRGRDHGAVWAAGLSASSSV